MDKRLHYKCFFLVIAAFSMMPGCSTFAYYHQAIRGHLDIMARREPIAVILIDQKRDVELIERLKKAQSIRDFASQELALPDNDSYRSYVDVGRQYVTWSVYAAPEFSLTLKQWCFPIAGCVPYRGYFSQRNALDFTATLRAEQLDVYVEGVIAYSTLGWFDDPLLNTMLVRDEIIMAGIMFHELAHQKVYVEDDTAFNEAFAEAVQQEGVRRWLRQNGTQEDLAAFEHFVQRKYAFFSLVEKTRTELATVYDSHTEVETKRAAKRAIIENMRTQYQRLKTSWNGYQGYDRWFKEPINNAKLAAVAIYHDRVPDFVRLLKECGGDFRRFYATVSQIGCLPPVQRYRHITRQGHCRPQDRPS
jgi:predicted aminopeptidase